MAKPEEHMFKVQTILRLVKSADNLKSSAKKEAIIAECGRVWGTARQTAQNYLKELVAQNQIVIDGDDIWLTERWDKIQQGNSLDIFGEKEQKQLDNPLQLVVSDSDGSELNSQEDKDGKNTNAGELSGN